MSRNKFIDKIKEILGNPNLSEEEKNRIVLDLCIKEEQGYGGMPLRKLLKQIENETGYSLPDTNLCNELGGIAKKGESKHGNGNDSTPDDSSDGDDLPPDAPIPSPVS